MKIIKKFNKNSQKINILMKKSVFLRIFSNFFDLFLNIFT